MQSIEKLIKQKIRRRVTVSIALTFSLFLLLSIYNIRNSLVNIQTEVDKNCKILEDYVISQILVPNQKAIDLKILDFNKNNPYKLNWVNDNSIKHNNFLVDYNAKWSYYYPLRVIGNNQFGYFIVKGSFFDNQELYSYTLPFFSIMLAFFLFLILLLWPLAKHIPDELFLKPVNTLLNTLRKIDDTNLETSLVSDSIEMEEISIKLNNLIKIIKQQSKDAAIGKTAANIAHNINSPLQTIFNIIEKNNLIKKISDDDYILLIKQLSEIKHTSKEILLNRKIHIGISLNQTKKIYLLTDILESVIFQKNIEWASNPCNIIFTIEGNPLTWVNVIEYEFKNMVSNLLNNSYEAMPKTKYNIHIHLISNLTDTIITIKDSGIGIPKSEILNVIGGKSLKDNGNGIGLSGAIQFLKSINGELKIDSTEAVGTSIKIILTKFCSPTWCAKEINIQNNSRIIIISKDTWVVTFWQKYLFSNVQRPIFLLCIEDFLIWAVNQPEMESLIVISEFEVDTTDQSLNTINILKKLNIKHAFIISSEYYQTNLQNSIQNSPYFLLSKSVLKFL